jgi:hypothetical protein
MEAPKIYARKLHLRATITRIPAIEDQYLIRLFSPIGDWPSVLPSRHVLDRAIIRWAVEQSLSMWSLLACCHLLMVSLMILCKPIPKSDHLEVTNTRIGEGG